MAVPVFKTPRQPTIHEEEIVEMVLREFAQMQLWRNTTGSQWEEIAELIDPPSRNTFFYPNWNWPGQKKTQQQIDASGMMALHRFGAILDSLLTPRNSQWHGLEANNDYVMKDRATRMWFYKTTKTLFKYRYAPLANFSAQNQGQYRSLGAYGTGGMFIDELDPYSPFGGKGIRYKSIPVGELFIRENHQGIIDGFIRWFRLNARQAYDKWDRYGTFPEQLRSSLEQGNMMPFNFLHYVGPNTDYDPTRLDIKGKPWASFYVSIEGRCSLQEGGYRKFPLAASRYEQTPGEIYGRGPASHVLPALKTLNAEKSVFLKQGHRAADPVLLTTDDGVVDFSLRPGALNKGGMNAKGQPLVGILPTGNVQVNEKMMDMENVLIQDMFLVKLFQILTESPQMTATEVIERTNEKGILLAPTVGRQSSEYLGPTIDREIDILSYLGLLDPMPPRLKEAEGEYNVVYTSPLARAAKAQEAAGFYRTVEVVKELVNITQDPSLLDPFDFDVAVPAIAEINAVPEPWMATPDKMAAKRKARAQAQAKDQAIKALPNQAAMVKAQAIAAKAGQPVQQPNQTVGQEGGLGASGGL